jgi:hypothetical protein
MTGEELVNPVQRGVVDVIITKQVTFRTKAFVCFDLDKRETFVMTDEEYHEAVKRFEAACVTLKENGLIIAPSLCVKTETGEHFNWIWRPDGNYSEYEVKK